MNKGVAMPNQKKIDEERLKKAYEPARLAMKYHPYYEGKIEVVPKCPIRSFQDFAIWYTPGVAEPCRDIQKNPEHVYSHTNKWNMVAVVTDGTRVLGLGDIGPEAGLPVMEGKALLFKYLGGVDAVPICLNTKDPDEIIQAVKWIVPSFGGINLEDIAHPKCFTILDRLRKEVEIPVWHDDQQGTATIVTAGAINALKLVGKKLGEAKVAMIGAGAANIAIARVLIAAGINIKNIVMVDSKGILHPGRTDLEGKYPEKWEMALKSNVEGKVGGIKEAMEGADIVIGASKPGPDVITKEMVRSMADDAIVFATANPVPEIWPWDAKEAGARIVATGRSDFPNQINNSLGFPGIFRGALDVRARTITDEMCIAAALELAKTAEDKGLTEEYIVPTMDDWEVFPREAVAVGMKAMEQGVARIKMSRDELYDRASSIIRRARDMTKLMMKEGCIPPPPD
ncbi:MAG: NADP-dependent malic enzyme [Methanomassiliicoccales archaeon]|jgi:malate dehydrogenase (oxaloacetate-decarboxylating)|nr:NADP-dependent malic enzyme [Methanomassiliicoccales archaeon]